MWPRTPRHDAPMPDPVETWQATVVGSADPEVTAAHLWLHGAITVEVRGSVLVGSFPGRVDDLEALLVPGSHTGVTWAHLPSVDHMAVWRASSTPVRAGRFDLVPDHLADTHTTPSGMHRIIIDAGMAFGSGHHDTTAGCLEHLGRLDVGGQRVLDVGTGTGILAIGAAMLGADHVVGVDTDAKAIEVARANAEANDVAIELTVGSTGVVHGPFDGILANLLTGLLVELAPDLAGLLTPGGWLIASGVGVARTHLVESALQGTGFRQVNAHQHGEWTVITAGRGTHDGPDGPDGHDCTDTPPEPGPAVHDTVAAVIDPDRHLTRWPPHLSNQQ